MEEGYRPHGEIIHIPKSAIKRLYLENNKKRKKGGEWENHEDVR